MDENDRNRQSADGRRAVNLFALRIAVAAYLVYLGFDIFRNYLIGASTLSPVQAWVFGPGFMVAGLAFAFYSWRRFRRERAAADERGKALETDERSDGGD